MNQLAAIELSERKYPEQLGTKVWLGWGEDVRYVVVSLIDETIRETPGELLDPKFRGTTEIFRANN